MYLHKRGLRKRLLSVALCVVLSFFLVAAALPAVVAKAHAEQQLFGNNDEANSDILENNSRAVPATYTVQYDYYTVEEVVHKSAPSYRGLGSTTDCGPITGLNVMVFFDRWYVNLIRGFEPGVLDSSGNYIYNEDASNELTQNTYRSIYSYMGTTSEGTTEKGFKNGLNAYVESTKYTLSPSSMYQSSKTVNLISLKTAIEKNRVGVLFLKNYNFALNIVDLKEYKMMSVGKINYSEPHIMMVYGYKKIAYYKNGSNFRTDTFLYASSGTDAANRGYILMNQDLTIVDAVVYAVF